MVEEFLTLSILFKLTSSYNDDAVAVTNDFDEHDFADVCPG